MANDLEISVYIEYLVGVAVASRTPLAKSRKHLEEALCCLETSREHNTTAATSNLRSAHICMVQAVREEHKKSGLPQRAIAQILARLPPVNRHFRATGEVELAAAEIAVEHKSFSARSDDTYNCLVEVMTNPQPGLALRYIDAAKSLVTSLPVSSDYQPLAAKAMCRQMEDLPNATFKHADSFYEVLVQKQRLAAETRNLLMEQFAKTVVVIARDNPKAATTYLEQKRNALSIKPDFETILDIIEPVHVAVKEGIASLSAPLSTGDLLWQSLDKAYGSGDNGPTFA